MRSAAPSNALPNAAWALTLVATVAVFAGAFLRLWGYMVDDGFISLRYAQHLAQGWGLVYNAGERVEGYTNFLWTVLLSVPFFLKLPLIPFIKVTSAVLALVAGWATWRLGRASLLSPELGRERGWAWLAAMLLLLLPATIISAAEGLETMLFTALLVLSAALFFEERARQFPWSAVVLAALAMTRPDGAVFAPFFFVVGWIERRPGRYMTLFAALFLVLFGVYFLWRTIYYGDLFPNTFYAKGGGSVALLKRGWDQLIAFVIDCGGWAWLAAIGAFVARRTRSMAITLLGIVVLRLAFHLWSGGPWMGRHRFLVPALPFLLVLTVSGIAQLRSPVGRRLAMALVAGLMLAPGWLKHPKVEVSLDAYGLALRRAHGAFGYAVNAHTRSDAVIAMDDGGLGPFLAQRTTIDMLGLNDHHIAHLPGPFGKFDFAYVMARRPDLIVLLSRKPDPRDDADFLIGYHGPMFRSTEFQEHYRLTRRFVFGPGYILLAFRRIDSSAVFADFSITSPPNPNSAHPPR